ncbi:hypothetical protein [Rhodopirellula bahusiensis]|uniref:hypothetical protein n=1 Tax=Rhodopirellula bahusiensis TaxID=2014065 RepID=UPI003265D245
MINLRPDYSTPAQLNAWDGKPSDFKEHETALMFEGLRKRDLLKAAGYKSLRAYVDLRLKDSV